MADDKGENKKHPATSSDLNHESPTPSSPSSITIRQMRAEDVDPCLKIFQHHNLVEAAHGLRTYLNICPGGCFVAVTSDPSSSSPSSPASNHHDPDQSEQVIGMCIGNNYDPRVCVIGFYGVAPGYQGKGIGKSIWNRVVQFLGPDANIMLYASPSEVTMYRDKAGFTESDGISMIVYESSVSSTITPIAPLAHETEDIQILPISNSSVMMSHVIDFDQKLIGMDRSHLITGSLQEPGTISFVAIDPGDKKVLGYGAMRETNFDDKRMMLAPMYAVNQVTAKILLYNLLINCPNAIMHGFSAFCLSSNPEAQDLMQSTGLIGNMRTPRLYTKNVITGTDETMVYSLLSPDFAPY